MMKHDEDRWPVITREPMITRLIVPIKFRQNESYDRAVTDSIRLFVIMGRTTYFCIFYYYLGVRGICNHFGSATFLMDL